MKPDVQKIYDAAFEGAVAKLKTAIEEPGELLTLVSQLAQRFTDEAKRLQQIQAEDWQAFLTEKRTEFSSFRTARAALRDGLNPKPATETGPVIKSKK